MADPVEVYHALVDLVVVDSIGVTIAADLVAAEVDTVAVIEDEVEVMLRKTVAFSLSFVC